MHATNSSLDQRRRKLISITMLLLLAAAPSVMAYGSITFNNRSVGNVVAPIYGPNPTNPGLHFTGNANTNGGTVDYTGFPLLAGTGFTAELWAENPANPDVFVSLYDAGGGIAAKVPFRTTADRAGFIQNAAQAVLVPWVPCEYAGLYTQFQVRAWDNNNGANTTYAAALAAGTRPLGISEIFTCYVDTAPGAPGTIYGFTSFNIWLPVPEPSAVVLGALAGAALLWRRKKVSR